MPYRNNTSGLYENPKPETITLEDGTVLEGDAVTHEILIANGWTFEEAKPVPSGWSI